MDLGRTSNNDHFALGSLGVGEELFIWYGGRHIGRVEYESLDEKVKVSTNTRLCIIRAAGLGSIQGSKGGNISRESRTR